MYRRAASSRNLNARKMVRSEPAFSDEEVEEDFQIVEEDDPDGATESAMDVEEEPPRLPTKKKGELIKIFDCFIPSDGNFRV